MRRFVEPQSDQEHAIQEDGHWDGDGHEHAIAIKVLLSRKWGPLLGGYLIDALRKVHQWQQYQKYEYLEIGKGTGEENGNENADVEK